MASRRLTVGHSASSVPMSRKRCEAVAHVLLSEVQAGERLDRRALERLLHQLEAVHA